MSDNTKPSKPSAADDVTSLFAGRTGTLVAAAALVIVLVVGVVASVVSFVSSLIGAGS